ncbi:MAG TPA: c-type cytochrome [Phototrophicaceae bacterium]|nr:c-type cytochrome [Phototrophicaceae bacterium]
MVGTRRFFAACLLVSTTLMVAVGVSVLAPRAVPPVVAAGSHLWHERGCAGCHFLLGQGGLTAPDLTQVYSQRGPDTLRAFLTSPPNNHPTLSAHDVDNLLPFLRWFSEQSLGWPPAPFALEKPTQ